MNERFAHELQAGDEFAPLARNPGPLHCWSFDAARAFTLYGAESPCAGARGARLLPTSPFLFIEFFLVLHRALPDLQRMKLC